MFIIYLIQDQSIISLTHSTFVQRNSTIELAHSLINAPVLHRQQMQRIYNIYITSMEQAEATQEPFPISQSDKTEKPEDQPLLYNPFHDEYQLTRQKYSDQVADKISDLLKYRQHRTYNLIVNDKGDYFSSMWQFMQKQLNLQSPYFESDLLSMVTERNNNILTDIMDSRLEVEQHRPKVFESEEELKQRKINMLRDQSSEIQRKLLDINESMEDIKGGNNENSQSRFKPFQIKEEKIKEYEEFMKKQKKEKEERMKLVQEQRKKEEELKLKKQQEEKEQKQKLAKERKEELLKKVKQNEEKREKQRMQREQRSKDYKFISKSLAQQPPLFKKIEQSYYNRYQQTEIQKRKKAMSERHSMFEAVDTKAIQQHERKYEDLKSQKQRQRRQRMEEYQRMIEMQQQEQQNKYKSNFQIRTNYVDKKEEERKIAMEKKEKVKKFIEETVKERYLPRIDEEKRKEFLRIIEEINNKKKMKKVKRQDGTYEYEEIKLVDPRLVGLEYLQATKEMAAKMRGKRKNSDNTPQAQSQKPRVFDYLAQQRKRGSSKSHRERLQFVNRKGLSFDDKLKKVEFQSQKLEELAKQKQMKLKFGKFTTSDEILQHKEEIDQHYIDIINMKLKLINYKEE